MATTETTILGIHAGRTGDADKGLLTLKEIHIPDGLEDGGE